MSNRLDDGVCQVTGLPFVFEGTNDPFCPSIDQIRPGLGYVYGNVRVVVLLFNTAKNRWTDEAVMQVARALVAKENA